MFSFRGGELQDEIRRALVAQRRGADAEVVGRRLAPRPRAVIVVIRGAPGVDALHHRAGLLRGASLPAADAADAVGIVGREEDIDAARILAQDVIGTAAHENRRFTRRDGADHVALNLEQRVVRQHVRHAPVVAHERRPQVADHGRNHAARLLLVGLLEKLGADAALARRQVDQLLVVELHAQPAGDDLPDGPAAAAQLAADVDDELFHSPIPLWRRFPHRWPGISAVGKSA